MLDLAAWLYPLGCLGCGCAGTALCAACAPPPAAALRFRVDGVGVTALAPYEGRWREAILAFKRGERAYAAAFARLLRARFAVRGAVVPVTTTPRRRAERGFDQAVEIVRLYAGPALLDVLRKAPGPAQHGSARAGRLALGGRYAVSGPGLAGRRVDLFDDVCTTGATLSAAIAALRRAGADVAGALVLARAQRFPAAEVLYVPRKGS